MDVSQMYQDIFANYSDILGVKISDGRISSFCRFDGTTFDTQTFSYNYFITNLRKYVLPICKARFDRTFSEDNLVSCFKNKTKMCVNFMVNDKSTHETKYYHAETFTSVQDGIDGYLTFALTSGEGTLLQDYIRVIGNSYYKILKINPKADTYEELKVNETSMPVKLSEWVESFISLGNVYHQDVDSLKKFISSSHLLNCFTDFSSKKQTFRYRRLTLDGVFRWVLLEVYPCYNYTSETPDMFLYVRDIQDDFAYQLAEQRKMYYLSTHDLTTGLKNNIALMNDLADVSFSCNGIVQLEIDNPVESTLLYTTEYLRQALNNCFTTTYFLDGAKFLIIFHDITKIKFMSKKDEIQRKLKAFAYVGFAFQAEKTTAINNLLLDSDQSQE